VNLSQFKTFVIALITGIIAKGDGRAAKDAATIAQLSADANTLRGTVKELEAALVASEDAAAKALVAKASEQAIALDTLSTELEETFNPTPVADAVAEAVTESPEVATPPVVESSDVIGEAVPTPPDVAAAAVEAIGAVFEVPAL
jgi:hypothetical protein